MAEARTRAATSIFIAALAIGLGLRLISVIWGDISPGGDGTERLSLAINWAMHPYWQGLSGVWPPVHWYFLGSLIRLWDDPIVLAKLVNLACGMGAVIAFRTAVRSNLGDKTASICSLLLAIFWTHIWLTSAYWVELPFILLVILAVHFSYKAAYTERVSIAAAAGLLLATALL
ncbi:MAG TPA: hypothetical protein VI756_19890, partial [Blastocatellia bacterium]